MSDFEYRSCKQAVRLNLSIGQKYNIHKKQDPTYDFVVTDITSAEDGWRRIELEMPAKSRKFDLLFKTETETETETPQEDQGENLPLGKGNGNGEGKPEDKPEGNGEADRKQAAADQAKKEERKEHPLLKRVLRAMTAKKPCNVWIYGPAGGGKNVIAEQCAAALNLINPCNQIAGIILCGIFCIKLQNRGPATLGS